MKEGKIKDVRIANKQVEIEIISGKERVTVVAPYNDSIIQVRKSMPCKYEEVNGKITKLHVGGADVLEAKPNKDSGQSRDFSGKGTHGHKTNINPPRNQENRHLNGVHHQGAWAQAPYNFVPVNPIVVEAPGYSDSHSQQDNQNDICIAGKIPSFDRYHEGLHTGFIDLTIETLTPLYIRDTYDENKEQRAVDVREKGEKWENPDFFSPGGTLRIPGSSLRGMIRNLVEIASWSRMEHVEDSTFYYRTMADECRSVKREYFNVMGERGFNKNTPGYKFEAGYLQRNGDEYQIIPAKIQYGRQYRRTLKTNKSDYSWEWQSDGSCITVSGLAPNDKKDDWLINPANIEIAPIHIPYTDLESYCNDTNRLKDKSKLPEADKKDGDLLRWLRVEENKENSKNMVPCFYVKWKDEEGKNHVSFGHTAYFRLAYRYSVKEHLPNTHRIDNKTIDLTTAIFGLASDFSGRVFFEDAHIDKGDLERVSKEEIYLKILATPKPTTFQHYLEQKQKNKDSLLHWNNQEGILRGYKMYWHRKTPANGDNAWQATAEEVKRYPSQHTKVKPVDAGCHFTGRIRFENLSDIELGALLFVLKLPGGCAHKIGMGKPLGLGSIRITPTLNLSRRTDKNENVPGHYARLFENHNWYLPRNDGKDIQYFKRNFAGFMLTNTSQTGIGEDKFLIYWGTERMRELRAMLDFDQNTAADKWLDDTRYMEIERIKTDSKARGKKENEFIKRPVLASPSEIVHLSDINYE